MESALGGGALVDLRAERVGHPKDGGDGFRKQVGGPDPGLCGRLNGVAVGAGEVRVLDGIRDFVADDGVPNTHLKIQAVADRRVQGNVGLFDAKVGGRAGGLGREGSGVWAEPQIHFIAGAPLLIVVYRLLQGKFDDVQVEAIRFARSAEGVGGRVRVAGAGIPLGGRINVAAEGRRGEPSQ